MAGLEIRDVVLIEKLDLDFAPGLNVLTGETGAGKSILLDALGFALGRKTRRDLVRAGAAQGSVTATFDVGLRHSVTALLAEQELPPCEDGVLVLRRIARADGPASAFVNDQRVSADTLRRIGARLVEVHGQHDDRGLLDPRAHGALLDAYAGLDGERAAVREAWSAMSAARRRLAEAEAALETAARDADFLRHAVAELEALAPEEGEEERLDAERRLMQAAQKIGEEVAKAAEDLGTGAEASLGAALSRLTRVADRAEGYLDAPIGAIDRALIELTDAQAGVAAALEALSFSPERLELVEERLFALRGLARKHDVHPSQLASLAVDLSARRAAIDGGVEQIEALRAAALRAEEAYAMAAEILSAARRSAAIRLDAAVTGELAPLKMEGARFRTEIATGEAGPDGVDAVSFTAKINPGAPAGAIDRIASGGELSRFLLALKVCLAERAGGLSLVFDEIDRGVGGATADAVGARLARLSASAQVLVVTHSPQVAAKGTAHWRIAKGVSDGVTRTQVMPLSKDERVEEVARMLAGETVTEAAMSAAEALLSFRAA
ncbi:MAG: DNA repair protein RecN [Pseudomonadota bacterium]